MIDTTIRNSLYSLLTLGLVGAAGISAAPAQASTLSTFAFADGLSMFVDQIDLGDDNDEFTVTFSPEGEVAINDATGVFVNNFPGFVNTLDPLTVTFVRDTMPEGAGAIGPDQVVYELKDDVVFSFDGGNVLAGLQAETEFLGTFNGAGGVNFGLFFVPPLPGIPDPLFIEDDGVLYTVDGGNTGFDFFNGGDLGFGQATPTSAASFQGSVEVETVAEVPEPSALLSILAVGGLGLVSKLKSRR